ncbi:hypothetical protein C8Q76DRAFT_617562 [Earliella scabrosa]|nr:hypothetical protein C8Q76DRAFT_617562 [Earliella scabrosa]
MVSAQRFAARLQATWDAPIYAFYKPNVTIGHKDGRRYHAFTCAAKGCKRTKKLRRYLDTSDKKSTGNLRKHVKACWGAEVLARADEAVNADEVRRKIVPGVLRDGTITAHFERKKGEVTYSHRQHTRAETSVVRDRGLNCLMKTGRPRYYIPSPSTVSRDLKVVFQRTRTRIAKMLQEYSGKLSFATDAWTSPNHRAFVAVTVHLEHNGEPLCMLLDLVEVDKVRTTAFRAYTSVGADNCASRIVGSTSPRHLRRSCMNSASSTRYASGQCTTNERKTYSRWALADPRRHL